MKHRGLSKGQLDLAHSRSQRLKHRTGSQDNTVPYQFGFPDFNETLSHQSTITPKPTPFFSPLNSAEVSMYVIDTNLHQGLGNQDSSTVDNEDPEFLSSLLKISRKHSGEIRCSPKALLADVTHMRKSCYDLHTQHYHNKKRLMEVSGILRGGALDQSSEIHKMQALAQIQQMRQELDCAKQLMDIAQEPWSSLQTTENSTTCGACVII